MKRILTPFLLSVGFAAAPLVAQNPIPNAGFNNWNTQTYEVPNHWMMIGKTSRDISKTLGYVNGVRLSNDVASGTVSFAMNVGSKYPDPPFRWYCKNFTFCQMAQVLVTTALLFPSPIPILPQVWWLIQDLYTLRAA